MADEDDTTTGDADEEGTGTSGEEGESSAAEDTEGTEGQGDGDGEEVTALKQKLAKANHEAAKFRRERNDARSELEKKTNADLSEVEREKKRADEAEKQLHDQMVRVQDANLHVALAERSDIVDVETAAMLLRRSGIEFDDEGKPESVSDAIDSLVKDKPYLVQQGRRSRTRSSDTNGGAGNDDTEAGGVQLTADELSMARAFKMTPEEYQKFKDVRPAT
jgi:hypothetical protein